MTKHNGHKTRQYSRLGLLQWSILLFSLSLNPTKGVDVNVVQQQKGTDNGVIDAESFSVSDGMRRLQDFSHGLLRGRTGGQGNDEENPLEAVSLAKDVLKSHLNQVKTRKEKFLSSNSNEEALTLLSSYTDEAKAVAQIAATSVDHTKEDRDILDSFSLAKEELHQRDLQALLSDELMHKEELASLLFDDDVIDFMQHTADVLEDIENDIMPNSHHRRTSKNTDQQKHNKFQPYSSSPNLPFSDHGHMKLPKLKVVEQLKAKRGIHGQRRLEEDLAPQCRKKCDEENEDSYLCNCQRLSDCAKELSWYDMAVRTLGGFVQGDADVDDYGGLNTEMEDINVFDARNDMGFKIVRIQDLARVEVMTEDTCTDLLEELHTACDEESCSSRNEYSLPLSVDDVCNAVNTTSKLKVKVMGDYYDFRNWIVPGRRRTPFNTVFVTSETYNGNLGGVAGADAKCQTLANNAKLPGTYYAWISSDDSNSSPSKRFKRSPYLDSLSYRLVDGREIANNWADLTNGSLQRPINMDEKGSKSVTAFVWTGIFFYGDVFFSSFNCNQWTMGGHSNTPSAWSGVIGTSGKANNEWSANTLANGGSATCNLSNRLYCFQQQEIEPEETPLNTKHAVRCCKDDSPIIDIDAELWSQKKASCPFTMKQLWTGESQEVTSQDTFLGYTLYSNRKCDGSNTVIGDEKSPFSPAQCRDLCNEDSSCVSFEYQRESSICILSSSCNHYDLTKTHQKFNWYFKHWSVLPPGYTKYEHRKCDGGTSFQTRTTQECANKCSVDRECASFSMNLETQSCNLSSICTHYAETTEDTTSSFNWYLKQDDDDKENEECPFLTYDKAKEYCEDAGGRVCTKDEIEDGCAEFTGCSFDTSLVWSKSEASPEVCPATSYHSGGEFVTAFETLYEGRNTSMFEAGNPMRKNQSQAAKSDFFNTQFPTGFAQDVTLPHGIAKIEEVCTSGVCQSVYLYEYENILSTTKDLYCDAKIGPPSLLAKAIDTSMNFLLGPRVSIGSLRSTANAVTSFDPDESPPEPRWLSWYTNLTDKDSIDFYNEWTSAYEKIEDPEVDPIWLGDYLIIRDPNSFIVSPAKDPEDQSVLDEIYCVDETVFSGSVENCQEYWLTDDINPYEDLTWYTSISYPTSDVAPFDQACDDADFCKVDWLENATNPFEEEDAGCYAFYNDCREADPGRYRCKGFWDYCRTNLTDSVPGWKYPKESCKDTSISELDFVTCPSQWLNDTKNRYIDEREQNESCYNFWDYCRNELDEEYPEWKYPRPSCRDDNGIEIGTCQELWLDDETNPYSSEDNLACHDFWDYCRLELVTNHERYAWPLPKNPTVDDFMPGYCCRDNPLTARTTEFWGDHYTEDRANRGMKCKDRGEWHMGMSPEACHHGGGEFYRSACITLKRCIDSRPREGEPGYRSTFEEWVKEEEVEIYDPYTEEQCDTARVALDYEPDHLDDQEICDTFNELLCDEFFEDLQWLEDEAAEGPVKFEQVKYTAIEYPKDTPLFFKPLPKEKEFIRRSDSANESEDWDDVVDTLEVAKRSLGFIKGNAMDAINKYIAIQENKRKVAKVKCDKFQIIYDGTLKFKEATQNTCFKLLKVVAGVSNPVYNICLAAFKTTIVKSFAAKTKLRKCNIVKEVGAYLSDTQKFTLWAVHYTLKLAHEGVDTALFAHKLRESKKVRQYEYVDATYQNVINHFQWTHDALGVMTNNTINQHTQMRQELQNRHQDIANDMGQYNTCLSNHLGNEILRELKAKTGPLSPLCSRLLGFGSNRRLNDDDEAFELTAVWGGDSLMGQLAESIGNERMIMSKENEIIDNQVDMKNITQAMKDRMATLQETVDNIAKKLDINPTKSDAKSKKSKKAKSQPKEAQDSETDDALFHRNLLAVEEAVMDKFDMMESQAKSMAKTFEGKVESIESKVDSMESKVESMENKVQSIEGKVGNVETQVQSIENKVQSIKGKVDNMEKTMEEMKDMLSQLMMNRGAAEADA